MILTSPQKRQFEKCNHDLDEAAGAADATACSTSSERELLTVK